MAVYLVSAFVLGIMSSLHCLGMCGPLVIGILPPATSVYTRFGLLLLYHGGRLMIYGILGLLVGSVAQQINLPHAQQYLSVILGSLMLLWVLIKYLKPVALSQPQWISGFFQQVFSRFYRLNGPKKYLMMGALNGLLPCGMVYIALTASATGASMGSAFLYMITFGAGTLPMLFTVSGIGAVVKAKYKLWLNRAQPVFLLLFAGILIVRGLNLGIPYLSPEITHNEQHAELECCKKK